MGVSFLRPLLATPAILLLVLMSATAAAATEVAPEEPPAALAAEPAQPSPMSVEFPRRKASLVGPRALVFVKCSGLVAETCEGTLVLSGIRGCHKVPYAIERGASQALAVPLGDADSIDGGGKARVVASTLQLTGGTVRTSTFLRVG